VNRANLAISPARSSSSDADTEPNPSPTTPEENPMSTFQQTFQVTGMTCGHCVTAVTEEVGAISDVTDVAVDLASGRVTVGSAREVTTAEMAAAIDEAGYELAS
jgi:copper chaperone